MKTRFSKVLSVLLCLSMLLSTFGFVAIAEETEVVTEYYVKFGGTGDGRSESSPAGAVNTVVKNIIADGHTAGDTVTVYIIDSGEGELCTEGKILDENIVLAYNAPAHTATIRYTSYSDDVVSVLGHCAYAGANSNGSHFVQNGPSIYENIGILDMRNSTNGRTDIYFNGYSTTLDNVVFYDLQGTNDEDGKGVAGKVWAPKMAHVNLGSTRHNGTITHDSVIIVDDASDIGDYISMTGYSDAGQTQKHAGDVTLKINGGTLGTLRLTSSKANEIVTGDMNIVLKGNTKINKIQNVSGSDRLVPVVEGTFQIIKNNGVTLPAVDSIFPYTSTARSTTTPRYFLDVKSADVVLDVTGTAGTFAVDGDKLAYAVSADGCTVYYGDETLALSGAGDYEVYAAEDVDAIIASVAEPVSPEALMSFDKWIDNGTTLTATFKSREALSNTYYVQYGGTGDGLTPETPVATVAEAVKLINADGLTTGDTATVYVMQSEDWDYGLNELKVGKIDGKNVAPEHHMTSWAGNDTITDAHKATINIIGYNFSETNRVYLAANSKLGNSAGMSVNGPVNFDNIILVDMRKAYRGISANGYDVTYGENCVFARVDNDMYAGSGAVWKGVNEANVVNADLGREYATSGGPGGTVIFKNVIDTTSTDRGVHLPSGTQTNYTFTDDVTVIFDNPAINVKFGFGAAKTTNIATLQGNLNIVVENATKVEGSSAYSSTNSRGPVNVAGAVQSIGNNKNPAVMPTANVTAALGIYTLSSETDEVSLALTDTVGKFAVTGDKLAYVVSEEGTEIYYSVNGFLTVPKGNYKVYAATDYASILAEAPTPSYSDDYEVGGWTKVSEGVLEVKVVAKAPEGSAVYYVQFGGTGNGLTPETPVGTVYDAVNLINAAGLKAGDTAYIFVMNDDNLPASAIKEGYPEFYWYDKNGNFVYNKSINGTNTVGRFTPWANKGGSAPAHTATIVVRGYESGTYLSQSSILGYNTNITLGGPTIFRELNILTDRAYDRELFINGHDVTFTDVKFMRQNGDNHSGAKYLGLLDGHMRVMLVPATGKGGKVVFNSPIPKIDGNYGLSIPGSQNVTFTNPVSIYLNGASVGGALIWGPSASTFNAPLSIIVNDGTYENKVVATDAIKANGGIQVIANNGKAPVEIPSIVTGKKWILTSADTTGNTLDVTETAGTFKVNSELYAIATSENGTTIFSKDGYLTVPEGTYTITYTDVVNTTKVYLNGKLFTEVTKGSKIQLPEHSNTPVYKFLGWTDGTTNYNALDYVTLPETADRVDFTARWEMLPDTAAIFVDAENGDDANSGADAENAVATLANAVELLENKTAGTKKIVILNTYTGNALPAHTEMLIIAGDGSENSAYAYTDHLNINGPTTFESIKLYSVNANMFIDTHQNKLVIGENVTKDARGYDLTIHAGEYNANSKKQVIEFNSTISSYVGPYYNSEPRTADGALVTVNAGEPKITFGADGWMANGATNTGNVQFGVVFTGKPVSIVHNGGTPSIGLATKYNTGFETSVQYIANNGVTPISLPTFPIVGEEHGLYILKGEAMEGCYLEPTDVAGTFNVYGGKTALAVSSDNKQYVSTNGVLTVPAGNYTVTYEDEVYYTNEGSKITFYKDFKLDLSTVGHENIDGKLFIGWADADGNAVTDFNFNEGEVIYAQYIDFKAYDKATNTGDFYIEGAQIRLKSATTTQGLRFIVRKGANLDQLNITSYGSVIAPSLAVGARQVTLGATFSYDGKTYAAKDVPAVKKFFENDEYEQYTVCVTGVGARYARMFTVRGYINYKDLNGFEHTMYTDYYATNMVNVANAAIKAGDSNSARYEAMVEANKAAVKEKYSVSETNTKTIPMNNYKDADKVAPASIAGLPYYTDFYQLGGAGGGMVISEITIETGKTNVEPLEIFQLTDIHFNYCNDQDFEEQNEAIMATYRGRKWNANGSSVPNAVRSLEYASQGDFTVLTGDVLDYMSWGCIELMRKYIWDTYPGIMATLGNHEMTRLCQPDPSTAKDPTTLQSRYDILQENWDHDIYYYSTVLDDRLMLIQLDNASTYFWANQVEPFANDLALAREKGYDVLLFYHIPLCTNNPKETDVYPIRRNDGYNFNFCTQGIGNSSTADDIANGKASKSVYDLIVNNGDIIKGTFSGHKHTDYYTEIVAKTATGESTVIPQFIVSGTPYDGGHAMKITVK